MNLFINAFKLGLVIYQDEATVQLLFLVLLLLLFILLLLLLIINNNSKYIRVNK